jgi:TolB-like protein/Flp pilus assembly protein TadD
MVLVGPVPTARSKLAVILHADVVGSTTLVQRDERIAHERIQDAFRRFSETITAYGGTTHEVRGDALVVAFERASDAVSAALTFQSANAEHIERLTDDIRPEVRVGIALGEVVIADRTVTGAGVVLAQRLEQLAEAGGVVIQGAISEAVPTRLPFVYTSLGEQLLKGFDKPIRAFSVALAEDSEIPAPEAVIDSETHTVDSISSRASIAVLPFDNLSNDPDQEYFADGIAEDLITALSRYRWFFVIARNSSFTYKGKTVDVKVVGKELGVRYVLLGSVRRAGSRIRVSAQLVDAETGNNVWADKFDRELEDAFVLQDEITETLAGEIEPELVVVESERARRATPQSLAAWDQYLRGMWHLWRFTKEDSIHARQWLKSCLAQDGRFAPALSAMSYVLTLEVILGFAEGADEVTQAALAYGRQAAAADPRDAFCHFALGRALSLNREHEGAVAELRKAIDLNPSFAHGYFGLAVALLAQPTPGPIEAVSCLERAMSLSPHDPNSWGFMSITALAHIQLERYDAAVAWCEQAIRKDASQYWPHLWNAAALANLGREAEAAMALQRAKDRKPNLSLALLRRTFLDRASNDNPVMTGLAKLGLIE